MVARFRFSIKTLLVLTALVGLPFMWGAHQVHLRRLEADAERFARAKLMHFDTTRLTLPEDASWIAQAEHNLLGPRVTKLVVVWNSQASKDCLSPFTELKELRFAGDSQSFQDLSMLVHMKSLEVLDLEGTSVVDLKPLASLPKLRRLYLRMTSVNDLGPLSRMETLRGLYLDDAPIDDLSPLSSLVGLEALSIRGTKVSKLEPIRSLQNLVELDISELQILDIQVLEALPKLEFLHKSD